MRRIIGAYMTMLLLVLGCDSSDGDPDGSSAKDGAAALADAASADATSGDSAAGPDGDVSDGAATDGGPVQCSAEEASLGILRGIGSGAPEPFGRVCCDYEGHSDCEEPAPHCSKGPFDDNGFCTAIGCVDTPSQCPAEWECSDFRGIGGQDFCSGEKP
jgi:hypothetical protein